MKAKWYGLLAIGFWLFAGVVSFFYLGRDTDVCPFRLDDETVELIKPGMTEAEVVEIVGGPAGDYRRPPGCRVGGTNYSIGSVGYSLGKHWINSERRRLDVVFDARGIVLRKDVGTYFPLPERTFQDRIRDWLRRVI